MNQLVRILVLGVLLFSGMAGAVPGQVNVNTASVQEIAEMLDGVGEARARAVVEFREQFGDFDSLEALQEVRGIGPHVIEANKDVIAFTD